MSDTAATPDTSDLAQRAASIVRRAGPAPLPPVYAAARRQLLALATRHRRALRRAHPDLTGEPRRAQLRADLQPVHLALDALRRAHAIHLRAAQQAALRESLQLKAQPTGCDPLTRDLARHWGAPELLPTGADAVTRAQLIATRARPSLRALRAARRHLIQLAWDTRRTGDRHAAREVCRVTAKVTASLPRPHVRRHLIRRAWVARPHRHESPEAAQVYAALRQQIRDLTRVIRSKRRVDRDLGRLREHVQLTTPMQLRREALTRIQSAAATQPQAYTVPAPSRARHIISSPEPGNGTLPPIDPPARPPRRSQHARALHRHAVQHLARMLYIAHADGWQSLNLSTPTGPASDTPRARITGGLTYRATLDISGVILDIDALITTHAYRAALAALTPDHQQAVREYYVRRPARGDLCPDLLDSKYTHTYRGFDALLDMLFTQGTLASPLAKSRKTRAE
ncbi:hypothetical protein [Deinococcus radiotolerans]|uniref:hypothetical protein n=1 Tax=Deinococcus radiotolerans TaxID=1309407 RepID=UPI001666DBEB|nr:hypothetical protein [Deinococcus radiotolerans]